MLSVFVLFFFSFLFLHFFLATEYLSFLGFVGKTNIIFPQFLHCVVERQENAKFFNIIYGIIMQLSCLCVRERWSDRKNEKGNIENKENKENKDEAKSLKIKNNFCAIFS